MASSAARSLRSVIRVPNFSVSPRNFLTPETRFTPVLKLTPKPRRSLTLAEGCLKPRKLFKTISGEEPVKETSKNDLLKEIFLTDKVSPVTKRIVPSTDSLLANYDGDSAKYNVLGKGSFGTVIVADHKGELVAAKIIEEQSESALKHEKNGLGLKHHNVVKVLDIIINKNKSLGIVIMEPCFGDSLQNLIMSTCPLEEKWRYLFETCLGLEYIHSKSILHLDVKPKNILVDKVNKTCKLCDFGSSITLSDIHFKTFGKLTGTVKYCAPEILKGEKPTFMSDVYSVGITIWHVLYEEIPYFGMENDILAYQVVSQNLRPESKTIQHKSSHIPEQVIQTYTQCWNSNPDCRPLLSDVIKKLQSVNNL